ncbi:MAG: signal recognition particle-docking protein FtsY [Nanoarchaeota archaeon]
MFSFLKQKIKNAVGFFTKKVEETPDIVVEKEVVAPRVKKEKVSPKQVGVKPKGSAKKKVPVSVQEPKKQAQTNLEGKKKGFFSRLFQRNKVPIKEEPKQEQVLVQEQKGIFALIGEKIVTKKINDQEFDTMFWELEVGLLENNVAVEVIDKIKADLRVELVNKPIRRGKVQEVILSSLRNSISSLFINTSIDIIQSAKQAKKEARPLVICMVGINGSGKTTTIAKLCHWFIKQGFSVVISASDTFRAAAIDQLQVHADKLGIKLIRHDYGSDPAAVAFDAIKHAESKHKDIVLIDTAGRMQSNMNLMDEMRKIIRVAKPDLTLFVGESITGNDCVEQARTFNDAVGIDGIILSKADIDEKGGAAISISFITKKPILFIGTGQEYGDLKVFEPGVIMESIGF